MKNIFACLLLAFASIAHAALTPAQQLVLKADIDADPVLSILVPSSDAVNQIVAAYAAAPAVACTVWRTAVQPTEYRAAITWTAVDTLTVGKARIWEWVTGGMTLPINAADSNVRQGIADAFGAASTTGLALAGIAKRSATRLEKLFATGLCTTASPSTMGVENTLSYGEVLQVMGW